MRWLPPLLLLLVAACSSSTSEDPAAAPSSDPPSWSWIGMGPEDVRTFTGPAGELTLIYVDETYDIAGEYASALTYEHDGSYVTDYFVESDGRLEWYGRKGSWRAGRGGEQPRPVPLDSGTATFGDITLTLSDDGPVSVETPDGLFLAGRG